jgi:hypothetical protein
MITFCLSYYNQPKEVLIRHINYWRKYPDNIKKILQFFIIDDCSKIPAHELLDKDDLNGLNISIYRINEDKFCNTGGVRNLGASECKTPYLLILDMDTSVDNKMISNIMPLCEENINNNIVFKFNRKRINNKTIEDCSRPHPAICLIRKEDYWNIGGCDEDMVGNWGCTDPTFWARAGNKVKIEIKRNIYLMTYKDGEVNCKKNAKPNEALLREKIKNNSFSDEILRFTWNKVY